MVRAVRAGGGCAGGVIGGVRRGGGCWWRVRGGKGPMW